MTDYITGQWYGWNDGECPVHPETVVDVLSFDSPSNEPFYRHKAKNMYWENDVGPSNIICFRIVTPYVEPEPKLECWNVYNEDGSYSSTKLTENSANIHAGMYCGANGRVVHMIEADEQE